MDMNAREKDASDRFVCSVKERAVFESGIKLATIYHQFVGSPVNAESVESLERTIEKTILVQPYVSDIKVSIDRSRFVPLVDQYSYLSLTGDMIDAIVTIDIDGTKVTAEMRYDEDLKYPLMYVSKISE